MGIIIAKFRKSRSTAEMLTKLDTEIGSIEEFQTKTRHTHKKIVFRFIILAIGIYASLALSLYFQFSKISQNQKMLWTIPFVTSPIVLLGIKQFLSWYYNRKIRRNERKLVSLKERKKKILENVMETETYKVAKDILDKFGTELKLSLPPLRGQNATPTAASSHKEPQFVMRQRNIAALNTSTLISGPADTSLAVRQLEISTPVTRRAINTVPRNALGLRRTSPALPRGILPLERSVLDKIVEYLVGDGPSNRYALICSKCNNHNGMALKEEFEYLAFRCCYCNNMNPARKMRPAGPDVNFPLMIKSADDDKQDESSNSGGNSESDSDLEPIVEEPRSDSPDLVETTVKKKASDSEQQNSEPKSASTSIAPQTAAEVIEVKESGDAGDTLNASNK